MKRLLVVVSLCALSALASAQGMPEEDGGGPPDPKAVAAKMSDHMKTGLKLSDEQASKVRAILEKQMPEKLELEKKLRASERKTHEAIRALLNDEQKEKFDMMRAYRAMARHGHMGMGRGMNGRPGGPGGMGPGAGGAGPAVPGGAGAGPAGGKGVPPPQAPPPPAGGDDDAGPEGE